jgi:hypothetical protein
VPPPLDLGLGDPVQMREPPLGTNVSGSYPNVGG